MQPSSQPMVCLLPRNLSMGHRPHQARDTAPLQSPYTGPHPPHQALTVHLPSHLLRHTDLLRAPRPRHPTTHPHPSLRTHTELPPHPSRQPRMGHRLSQEGSTTDLHPHRPGLDPCTCHRSFLRDLAWISPLHRPVTAHHSRGTSNVSYIIILSLYLDILSQHIVGVP